MTTLLTVCSGCSKATKINIKQPVVTSYQIPRKHHMANGSKHLIRAVMSLTWKWSLLNMLYQCQSYSQLQSPLEFSRMHRSTTIVEANSTCRIGMMSIVLLVFIHIQYIQVAVYTCKHPYLCFTKHRSISHSICLVNMVMFSSELSANIIARSNNTEGRDLCVFGLMHDSAVYLPQVKIWKCWYHVQN